MVPFLPVEEGNLNNFTILELGTFVMGGGRETFSRTLRVNAFFFNMRFFSSQKNMQLGCISKTYIVRTLAGLVMMGYVHLMTRI